MKSLKITHYFDVIKKETTKESEAVTPITHYGNNLKIKVKQECNIKEEVDIPWDEASCIVPEAEDDIFSSEKHISMFNARVIIEKLPDSIVQNYFKSEPIIIGIQKKSLKSCDLDVVPEKLTEKIDRNTANERYSNTMNFIRNKNGVGFYDDSQFYWKTCTACNKRYEIVRHKRKMRECQRCKTRLLYECKKCHKQLSTASGMQQHMRSKCVNRGYYYQCFECDYKGANKGAVSNHVRVKHPTMTSHIHSRIVKVECENVQNDLIKAKHKCSKCERRFEHLPNLMRHIQICVKAKSIADNKSQGQVELQTVRDQMLICCKKCNKELKYISNESDSTTKHVKLNKKRCLHCKSTMVFKCTECKREYASRHGLAFHIRGYHISKRHKFKCSECDYKSDVLEYLTAHYSRKHTTKIHECSKCGMEFQSRSNLTKHLYRCGVIQPRYNCEHCSYKSYDRGTFINHIIHRHMTETSIDCPTCKSTLKNKMCLRAHLMTCGKQRLLQCDHCPYKTKYTNALKGHLLRMHSTDGEVECPNCKKITRNRHCLKDHLKYCKPGNSFQCKICSFKTKYPASLRDHALRMHGKGNDANTSVESGSSSSAQLTYQCDHCSYNARTKSDMYEHIIRKHLVEKDIECQRCNETFQNSIFLGKHLKYCGLKPYLCCKECSFKTYLKGKLTVHIEKNHMKFECPKCKGKFKSKGSLICHLNRGCKKKFKAS